tara:strand:+ start:344 stop:553 length:210 start_codon:yes stop_codon:yes gene_type:complete
VIKMKDEIENIKKEVRNIHNDIRYLEQEHVELWKLARAINEIQDELRKLHPKISLVNDIYAPTQVGQGR